MVAAEAALGEKGYHGLLLDDVARHAHVAKGTLYLYFQNKEDLLADFTENIARDFAARASVIPGLDQMAPLDQLRAIVKEQLTFLSEHKNYFAEICFHRPEIYGRKAANALRQHHGNHVRFLAGKIQKCIESGDLRGQDPSLGALTLLALVEMAGFFADHAEPGTSTRVTDETVMALFLKGLGREK
ncbi:MAG: TetR/AcrR family transcriptional regulator [Elusimicrobia bacterium]|nr:TetR/AcrR family transcriptional regulator [Elusimicrobiota bacterium]